MTPSERRCFAAARDAGLPIGGVTVYPDQTWPSVVNLVLERTDDEMDMLARAATFLAEAVPSEVQHAVTVTLWLKPRRRGYAPSLFAIRQAFVYEEGHDFRRADA